MNKKITAARLGMILFRWFLGLERPTSSFTVVTYYYGGHVNTITEVNFHSAVQRAREDYDFVNVTRVEVWEISPYREVKSKRVYKLS